MGNTVRELSKRLLHLLPIDIIRDEFKVIGKLSATDIIEDISGKKSTSEIKKFVFKSHSYTRQNIYLFELSKSFARSSIKSDFPFKIEEEEFSGGQYTFFFLPVVSFEVYLNNPVATDDIKFLQPLIIKIKGNHLIIQYTKIESQMKYHFPLTREAKKNTEENTEDVTLKEILSYFNKSYTVTPLDINKGVKKLWHLDDIDCIKISSRDPDSTTTTNMDVKKTYKKRYPARYKTIIKAPINSAIWKYLLKDNYLCEIFTADLTAGTINISRAAKNSNQVNNVIAKILTNN